RRRARSRHRARLPRQEGRVRPRGRRLQRSARGHRRRAAHRDVRAAHVRLGAALRRRRRRGRLRLLLLPLLELRGAAEPVARRPVHGSRGRRGGAGKALMARLASIAAGVDATHLAWTADERNVAGMTFYRALGAEIVDQRGPSVTWRIAPAALGAAVTRG